MTTNPGTNGLRVVIRLALLTAFILLLSYFLETMPDVDAFNRQWVDTHTRGNGIKGILGFIGLSAMLMSLGAPRQLVALLGGYGFGFLEGMVYATLAAEVSCACTFLLARSFARPWLLRFIKVKVARIDAFLAQRPVTMTMVIRLLPVGNNLLTNLAAGITTVRLMPFLVGSLIGYLPQMAIFALMGKGLVINSVWQLIISVLLFTLAGTLSVCLYKMFCADNLQTATDSASDDHANSPVTPT